MQMFFISHDFSGISPCRRFCAQGYEVRARVGHTGCHAYAGGEIRIELDRA